MAEKTNSLTCKQCGYVNEGERVYCHNCGTKLDRSLLPSDSKAEESLEKKQKRIKKIVSPTRGFYAGLGKTFCFVMLWAVLLAAVIQIARPPRDVQAKLKGDEAMDVRPIGIDLEDAMQYPTPKKVTMTQKEINTFLQYTLKPKAIGLVGDEVKFVRAFTILDEGVIQITTEQTNFDYPLNASASYKLAIKDQKITGTVTSGSFGRLMIDPRLMNYLNAVFQNLWDALAREKKLLDQFESIEVHKDHLDLTSKPLAR
jgi:hypothetical protein